jgi:hypothetical protein
MKALVACLPAMGAEVARESFRVVALKILGRSPAAATSALNEALSLLDISDVEGLVSGCDFLLRQARRPGVTVEKMAGRLSPLGFRDVHLQALEETISWIDDGGPEAEATLELGTQALDSDDNDGDEGVDEDDQVRIDRLIAEGLSDSDVSASSSSDDEESSDSDVDSDDEREDEGARRNTAGGGKRFIHPRDQWVKADISASITPRVHVVRTQCR